MLSRLLLGLAGLTLLTPALAQEADTSGDATGQLEGDARALYAIGVSIGDQLKNLDVNAEDLEPLVRGLRAAALGEDVAVERSEFQQLIPKFQQARQQRILEQEKAASETFVEEEAAKESSKQFESGLVLTRLKEGSGESPGATDEVKVHYRGTNRQGEEFDSSIGGDPVVFPLNKVIKCWTEALQKMKVGGKARIVCPSDIAYGDRGQMPVIKPGAALVFEVELLEVLEKSEETESEGDADSEGTGEEQ
jgi:FKBP-type peptidyl-prolyl cis-trans isomerase FkpA